jgi:hypothetical protein
MRTRTSATVAVAIAVVITVGAACGFAAGYLFSDRAEKHPHYATLADLTSLRVVGAVVKPSIRYIHSETSLPPLRWLPVRHAVKPRPPGIQRITPPARPVVPQPPVTTVQGNA